MQPGKIMQHKKYLIYAEITHRTQLSPHAALFW
jgi:hypothetical protein